MNDNYSQVNTTVNDNSRMRRRNRRARVGRGGAAGGILLIGLGVLLYLQNLNAVSFGRWWALLLLVPAGGAFYNAWQFYRQSGSLSGMGLGSLVGGILLTMVTASFLFALDWGWVGPALLILGGAGILFRGGREG